MLAAEVIDSDPDETNRLCIEALNEDRDNPKALFLMGVVMLRAEKWGLAYNLFKRVVDIEPKQAAAWNNIGMALESMTHYEEARKCFDLAINRDPGNLDYQGNVAMVAMQAGKYVEARALAKRVLAKDARHIGANVVLGMSSLALGNWREGWAGYDYSLGGKFRKEMQYQDEPKWDGKPTDCLILYAEQGLGDEIMYSSCVGDIRGVGKIVLECDERLEGLLQRSFPHVNVHGTRRGRADWSGEYKFTARCALGGLPMFYRNSAADFPRQPFLTADLDRRLQWRALFDQMGRKPKIGVAWSGGRANTGAKRREVGIEALRPLIEGMDADFISLQYRDPKGEIKASGMPIHHFDRACRTNDYDDLAGMVAELDMVVGVHTAALHLAGGLGVPVVALVPSKPSWCYAQPDMLWYGDYKIHRQLPGEKWPDTVKRALEVVKSA